MSVASIIAPVSAPAWEKTGAMLRLTITGSPLRRGTAASIGTPSTCAAGCSGSDAAGIGQIGHGAPSTSAAVHPKTRSAAPFQVWTRASVSSSTIAVGAASISARNRSPLALAAASLALRSWITAASREVSRQISATVSASVPMVIIQVTDDSPGLVRVNNTIAYSPHDREVQRGHGRRVEIRGVDRDPEVQQPVHVGVR